jgi:dTDP-glucose pyrophosphorylase
MSNIKGIIPAAGYGVRMAMKPTESKEMLTDPITGKYLIDYSLDLCYSNSIEPIVISRLEKEDLNSYLRSKGIEHIVLKTPGKEWAETVLKSQGLWGEKNILILPDTRFDEEGFKEFLSEIENNTLTFATHEIKSEDCDKWGIVTDKSVYEKPGKHDLYYQDCEEAWGLIGWHKCWGEQLFKNLHELKYFNHTHLKVDRTHLKWFKDVTRSGTLEKY